MSHTGRDLSFHVLCCLQASRLNEGLYLYISVSSDVIETKQIVKLCNRLCRALVTLAFPWQNVLHLFLYTVSCHRSRPLFIVSLDGACFILVGYLRGWIKAGMRGLSRLSYQIVCKPQL